MNLSSARWRDLSIFIHNKKLESHKKDKPVSCCCTHQLPVPVGVSFGFEGPLKPWWGQLRTIRKVHSHSVLLMLFISVPVKNTLSYENFIVIHTGLVNPEWRLTQVGDVTSIYRLHCAVHMVHTYALYLGQITLSLIRGGGGFCRMKVPLLEIGLIVIKQSRRPSPVLLLRDSKTCESPPK